MIRYFVLLTRNDDLTHAEFRRLWSEEHLPLIRALPGLVEAELLPTLSDDAGYDGVGLLHFETEADLDDALQSDAALKLGEHTATFAKSEGAIRLLLDDDWL
jgi:uncharacterized protein (TIGR02118 family)